MGLLVKNKKKLEKHLKKAVGRPESKDKIIVITKKTCNFMGKKMNKKMTNDIKITKNEIE